MNEELLFTFLREGYYPDLTKAPGIYDAFDCISMQADEVSQAHHTSSRA
jgi:hypothetical protein